MTALCGMPVTLYTRTQTGTDAFGAPVYTEAAKTVENVLVAPADSAAIVDELQLTGHRLAFTLYVPKDDANEWTGRRVAFYGQEYRCYAPPEQWQAALVPGPWNKRVKVERYDAE